MLRKTLAAAIALALIAPVPLAAKTSQSVTYTLPEAQLAAQRALADGNFALALQLGLGLLEADPNDGRAHYIVAAAQAGLGNPREGRKAARKAFGNATVKTDKFIAAQVAARLSLKEKKYTLAQYWLRRSLDTAPTEQARAQVVSDFKRLKSIKKLNWSANLSFSPSNNVNAGTDDVQLTIEGVPTVGILDSASLPLAGYVAKADIRVSYKLSENARSRFQAKARMFRREVWLSSSAKALAPTVDRGELSSATYEVELEKLWLNAKGQTPALSGLGFTVGRNETGGRKHSDTLTLSYSRQQKLSKTDTLTYGGHVRKIYFNSSPLFSSVQAELRGSYTRSFENGGYFQSGLVLGQNNSRKGNTTNKSVSAYVRYGFGPQLGPAKVDVTLGARYTDYPRYFVGFIEAPDGRKDTGFYGALRLRFVDFERAGLIPTAAIQYNATASNISRFTYDGASISLGISSSF